MNEALRAAMMRRLEAEGPAARERLNKLGAGVDVAAAILADPVQVENASLALYELELAPYDSEGTL